MLLSWLLIIGGTWHFGGLLFATRSLWNSPTYTAMRGFPGIRVSGVILAVLIGAFIFNLAASNSRALRFVTSAGFIYYLCWFIGILISWVESGKVLWNAPVYSFTAAGAYLILLTKIVDAINISDESHDEP